MGVLDILPQSAVDYLAGIEYDCYAGLHSDVWVERGGQRIASLGQVEESNDGDLNRIWDNLQPGDYIKWQVKTIPNMGSSTNPLEATGGSDVVNVNLTQQNWFAFEQMLDEAWEEAPEDKKTDLYYILEKGNEKFNELPISTQRLILSGSGEYTTNSRGLKTGQFQIPWNAVNGDMYNLGFVYGYSAVSRSADEEKNWKDQQDLIIELAYLGFDIAVSLIPLGAIFKLGKWGLRGVKFAIGSALLTVEVAERIHASNEYFEKVGVYAGENKAGCGFTDTLSPLVTTYAFVVGNSEQSIADDDTTFDLDAWLMSNQDKVGLFVLGASVLTIAMIYSMFGGDE